ncbi:MAG: L-rhamnose/proton symporter RhaT [Thermoguttaceae bacterium]
MNMDFTALLGVPLYVLGGMIGSAFYLPLRGVRRWAWESYWMIYALVGLIVFPWTIAACTTPGLLSILRATPGSVLLWCYLFGAMWGIGGLTFGITIRYLGVGLGTALACGIIAAVGTLVPPVYGGQVGSLLSTSPGIAMLCGVAVAILGIFATGTAGMSKERELSDEAKKAAVAEFNFVKGLMVAIFCGVTSAGMFLGIRAGDSMEAIAVQSQGVDAASPWIGLPKMVVILAGGFTVNCVSCLILNLKNRSLGDYANREAPLLRNYLLSAAAGILWYSQFIALTIGDTHAGLLKYSNASMLMSSIILFGTTWGILLHEWKGTGRRTRKLLAAGLALLILSFVITGYGNILQQQEKESPHATQSPD